MTGIIRFSGTAPFRRIEPRNWSEPPTGDIHVISKANVIRRAAGGAADGAAAEPPESVQPDDPHRLHAGTAGTRVTVGSTTVNGKLVRTVFSGDAKACRREQRRCGTAGTTRPPVGTGVYLYRLHAGEVTQTRKMMLLK